MQVRPSLPALPLPQKRVNRLSQNKLLSINQTERIQFNRHSYFPQNVGFPNIFSQTSRISPAKSSLVIHRFIIKIEILSNYGHPDEISLSEIDILDQNNAAIYIEDIRFIPQITHKTSPQFLINSCLMKENVDLEWCANWDHNPFSILLVVSSPSQPSSLRIWNSQRTNGSNVQEIKIYDGYTYLTSYTIPESFGSIISLKSVKESSKTLNEFINHDEELKQVNTLIDEIAVDDYGEIPILLIESIRIEILETINPSSRNIGINALEFYYPSGKQMNYKNEISHIDIENIEALSSPHRLFRPNRSFYSEFQDGFIASKISQFLSPKITIFFRWPLPICLFVLSNLKFQHSNEKDCGIKKLKIVINSKGKEINSFIGTIGNVFNNEINENQNLFWFIDSKPIRMKILSELHVQHKRIALSKEPKKESCIPLHKMRKK